MEISKILNNYKEIEDSAKVLISFKKNKTMTETHIIEFIVDFLSFPDLLNIKIVCKYYSNTVHNLFTKTSISLIESIKKIHQTFIFILNPGN